MGNCGQSKINKLYALIVLSSVLKFNMMIYLMVNKYKNKIFGIEYNVWVLSSITSRLYVHSEKNILK